MAFRRSIRIRRARRKIGADGVDLQLTAMMDILVIIVVFLLKSYSTSTHAFSTVPGLELPISASQDLPTDTLHVLLTPEAITFEGERIVEFIQGEDLGTAGASYAFRTSDLDEGGRRIVPLYDALSRAREKAELLRAKSTARDESGNPLPFEGVLAISADKRVKYDTLRKVMYTSAASGYRVFRFLAQKRE